MFSKLSKSTTDLIVGLEQIGVVVGERPQALLVLAAVCNVLLENLPSVDGGGPTVPPLEICPMVRRRPSPRRAEIEPTSEALWINSETDSLTYLVLLSVETSVTVPLLILAGDDSNSDEEQRDEQVE